MQDLTNNKNKIHSIQSLRGVAVLLVLLFHVMLMEKKWGGSERLLSDFLDIGQTGIDLFFIISGFVMTTVTRGKFQDPRKIIIFLYNRLSRIYPPYWFYSLILLFVFLIRPDLVNPTLGHQVNIVESFLLLPQDTLPLLMVGWTLIYEMYFYILFGAFLLIRERHLLKILLIWAGIIFIGTIFFQPLSSQSWVSPGYLVLSPFSLEFILGCVIARIIYSGRNSFGRLFITLGLVIFLSACIYYQLYPSYNLTTPWMRAAIFGTAYSLALYGSVALEFKENKIIFKSLKKIGNASYSIYLSHSLVINGLGWFWVSLKRNGLVEDNNFILITSMLVMSIITGFISYRLIELPLISVARRFSGAKLFKIQPK